MAKILHNLADSGLLRPPTDHLLPRNDATAPAGPESAVPSAESAGPPVADHEGGARPARAPRGLRNPGCWTSSVIRATEPNRPGPGLRLRSCDPTRATSYRDHAQGGSAIARSRPPPHPYGPTAVPGTTTTIRAPRAQAASASAARARGVAPDPERASVRAPAECARDSAACARTWPCGRARRAGGLLPVRPLSATSPPPPGFAVCYGLMRDLNRRPGGERNS